MLKGIDHLVIVVPELEAAIAGSASRWCPADGTRSAPTMR